ncbi:acyl CoA:acetate/3-ketoacid CoA transferase subunit alpha [Alteribacter lacisalsi]|uniref:Acyl CoA:acetate/3-ketoacid CoA transferase subunit alpha n=1 Tax=Alteribacter lacisalsi TaxID=2045244 RepID=A0A2W0HBX6_9BACI|nr:CoA transferase subunit A [Alteribacter lacisalsi]PYZ98346.1 acyl CoA:acetate/3-ketoacid CoA transferase subunit alpha [Alteribacter lacisalsi]
MTSRVKPVDKLMTLEHALDLIETCESVMFGGFGGVGNPPTLIDGILERGITGLTLIGNDAGFPDIGIGRLISERRVKKIIASHIGSNPVAGKQMTDGDLEVEFSPQGTLAERIRAGGVGLGGVLVDTGLNNEAVTKGKKRIMIKGCPYLLETALTADVSIVYAKKADKYGNAVYDTSARNTNPLVAMAGNVTIIEAAEIVETGELNPEEVVTPGVFVDGVLKSKGVNWTWAWEKK